MNEQNAIAKWREIRNVSQKELAEHLHINRALLSQIETGIVLPSNKLLIEISRYLDCLITDLLKIEKNENKGGGIDCPRKGLNEI